MYDELLAGNNERIAAYCLRDVEMMRAVYYKMCYEPVPETRALAESAAARSKQCPKFKGEESATRTTP